MKFNTDGELLINKMIQVRTMTMVVRDFFMKIINIIHKFFYMKLCISYK